MSPVPCVIGQDLRQIWARSGPGLGRVWAGSGPDLGRSGARHIAGPGGRRRSGARSTTKPVGGQAAPL